MPRKKYFMAKATETRLFARVKNPAICGGLDSITIALLRRLEARKRAEDERSKIATMR